MSSRLSDAAFVEAFDELVSLGYHPLPIKDPTIRRGGKAPGEWDGAGWRSMKGWDRFCLSAPTPDDRDQWAAWPGRNIGVCCGSPAGDDTFLVGLDIDPLDPADQTPLNDVLSALGLDSAFDLVRLGKKGGVVPIRVPGGAIATSIWRRADANIDILASGRQFVAPPSIHPDTHQPYVWTTELSPVVDLPRFDDIEGLLRECGFEPAGEETDAVTTEATSALTGDLDPLVDADDVAKRLAEHPNAALADLWARGPDSEHLTNRKDQSGSACRLELARFMRHEGFSFSEHAAALSVWEHTIGDKGFDLDRDLNRPDSRTADAWIKAEALGVAGTINATDAFSFDMSEGEEDKPRRAMFTFTTGDQSEARGLAVMEDLVEDWLGQEEVSVLYGPANVGKTFLATHLGCCVAGGLPFGGKHKVIQGAVLYVSLEGGPAFFNRVTAIKRSLGLPEEVMRKNFIVAEGALVLTEQAIRSRFIKAVRKFLGGRHIALIIIDTFARSLGAEDENDGRTMNRAFVGIDELKREFGAHTMLVHHPAKAEGSKARGHGGLIGGVDTIINVKPLDGRAPGGTMQHEKQRNREKGPDLSYSLARVEVHPAEGDRKTVTSAIVKFIGDGRDFNAFAFGADGEDDVAQPVAGPKALRPIIFEILSQSKDDWQIADLRVEVARILALRVGHPVRIESRNWNALISRMKRETKELAGEAGWVKLAEEQA